MLVPNNGFEAFLTSIRQVIPADNVLDDMFSRVTHGADASPYSLVPRAVLLVETEEEIVSILSEASRTGVPVTFRAAGTSLSGQGVTDSVLVKLGHNGWRQIEVLKAGQYVRVGPAMVGAQVNARLAQYHRKIGPDPASIGAAMMGGITANNSSGMCCGTEQNTYRTLRSMRIVFTDGSRLDTGNLESRASFTRTHAALLGELSTIASEVAKDAALTAMIRRKYQIKNTIGYSLNALIDFRDPVDILQHLLVGSEGTLAFISEVTLKTVPDPKLKSAALVLFPDMRTACAAATRLKPEPVSAVELMDFASLVSVIGKPGIPDSFATLPAGTVALLVDLRAETAEALDRYATSVEAALASFAPLEPPVFSTDPVTYANYWNVRKGLLPSVGGVRPVGTTVIVEDVAVPIEHLADAAIALRDVFDRLSYKDAIIFGHALDGNLHFVFSQSFSTPAEIERYALLTAEITKLIAVRFKGALKAEHGTGRAMAPFVELEWGSKAYSLMRRIKALFDPMGILSPGVVIADDPEIYLKALKALPAADPIIDKCIECGFCEPVCPSRALTTTPRQRIVATRALAAAVLQDESFRKRYDYAAVDTCAGDGLCARSCPVGIDTGEMMRTHRRKSRGPASRTAARAVEHHIGLAMGAARAALGAADLGHRALGTGAMKRTTRILRRLSGGRIPLWTPYMPTPGREPVSRQPETANDRPRVVLFSSCVSRVMGPARGAPDERPLWNVLKSLFEKVGYDAVLVTAYESACCGMPFQSKGFPVEAATSAAKLAAQLLDASRGGHDVVVSDTSPCSNQMTLTFPQTIRPVDITAALATLVLPKLNIHRKAQCVALHITCSTRKMGQDALLVELANACADEVFVPREIECCGFGGDKGFDVPELNASALRTLRDQMPRRCTVGYSTSRTCEIGLSAHSYRHYQSIAYLLDWASAEETAVTAAE